MENLKIPLNKALDDKVGVVELKVYDSNPNMNSIDEANMSKISDSKFRERVESVALEQMIDMFNGENIDFLKMDCEGCEYKVLRGLPEYYFYKILNINIEYHHECQDIQEILKKQGFHTDIFKRDNISGYITATRLTF